MALLSMPSAARAELVPGFYRNQSPIGVFKRGKGIQRQRLDMLLLASK
jgi:hypothetical protein